MAENEQNDQVEQKETTLTTNSFENAIALEAFGQLIDINEGNIIHEPTCAICNNSHRAEIEQMWIEKKNLDEIKKVMDSKLSIPNLRSAIENHVLYHFNREVRELQKKEYIDKIQRLTAENLTNLQRIKISLAAIRERLAGINSIVPTGDIGQAEIERIKSSETSRLLTTESNLLKIKYTIENEMKKTGELITIPRQSFLEIFNSSLINAKTSAEKNAVQNILQKLMNLSASTQ